jgi:hypothetical protein
MKSILDPAFRYVPAAQSDIRRTFARIRREQEAERRRREEESKRVTPITRKKGTA